MDPSRNAYSGGSPPRSGRYTLAQNGTHLDVSITGELASGDPIAVDYTLDLLADTPMTARAWRILNAPNEMTIVQSAPDPDGLWRDDVSVYRRA